MKIIADTADEYISKLNDDRREAISKLREVILENLPEGFEEGISYGMISYFVPHSVYPYGYHVNPSDPLPFLSIASQKNHIAIYHSGIYMDDDLKLWFENEFPDYSDKKLNMAKSCIRFRKSDDIPFELIAKLVRKVKSEDFIKLYESKIKS